MDYSAIWDENATEYDVIETYQALINNGMAWQLEGHVGRTAMALIQDGVCMLGETSHTDYYGNYIPSRDEVPGKPGSPEYVEASQAGE